MVFFTRLSAVLSLVILATIFLASLIRSPDDDKIQCATSFKTTNFTNLKTEKYMVFLKAEDNGHKSWLNDCWDVKKKPIDIQSFFNHNVEKNTALDLTIEGTSLKGYIAHFSPQFVKEHLSTRSDVEFFEKDSPITLKNVIPSKNKPSNGITEKTLLPNLDRIDQSKLPLDGSYTFPASAGKGVNVYVIDTGINIKHVEFGDRAKVGGRFCDGPGCDTDNDDKGHSSHITGIIGGKTVGVANQVNLISVKILDANVPVIKAMSFSNKNTVVNVSVGGVYLAALNNVVKSLTDAGAHVVTAAGNNASDACFVSPASAPEAITVGALEEKADALAKYSNVGNCVNIIAPGTNIQSVDAKSNDKFTILTGTSQAAPHVSGAIALIIAKEGNKSPAEMAKTIINLSTKNLLDPLTLSGTPNNILRIPAP
ncbi:1424_t:CDS:2 [Entrophospora sp. SA101]|nr:8212_t:CDS:2 [Entrophospora sp. SA101]CAJ0825036.1 1424_t:CDS:2 [Entrophospora sp. SA101]